MSNIECWLGSFVSFRGSGPVLFKETLYCNFLGGGGGGPNPLSPHLDPRMWHTFCDRINMFSHLNRVSGVMSR